MPQDLIFPDYRPDQPPLSDVMAVADNVLPGLNGYRPLPQFVALPGTALPGYPLGAGSFLDKSRFTTTFAGTSTNLYQYSATGWSSVGSGFNGSDDNPWVFQQFGQWVIATNGADAPQYFVLGSSASFAPLPGEEGTNPPRMKLMGIVANFLVGGVIDGNTSQIQWAAFNSATEWRIGIAQGDRQTFADGGDVTAIASGEVGYIFQSDSIRRMDYVGGDEIFLLGVISPNIGCVHPRAFAQVGRLCFFRSARGFMQFDGATVTPIGDERVDASFEAEMDRAYMGRMACVADPQRKVVYWSVPKAEPDTWYAYSWALQRWSRVKQGARLLAQGLSRDISLDEEFGTPDTLWDTGLSFDDPSYNGGAPVFYVFNSGNALGAMTGTPAAAVLATPLIEPEPGLCLRISRVRPLTDATGGLTLTLDARVRTGDAAATTTHSELTIEGDMPALRRGRHVGARFSIAAGTPWTFFKGARVTGFSEGGLR
jgi:hypothetical protein